MVANQLESRSPDILATGDEPRIQMKPAGAAAGYVDGGWWPRSTDPAVEFPALVRALHGVVGQVGRVVYHLGFWEPVHRKLTVDGRIVRCEGFHTMNPQTVTAIGANSRRVTLLVVLPATSDRAAGAALRAAAEEDSAATVEDILTGSGARSDVGAATAAPKPLDGDGRRTSPPPERLTESGSPSRDCAVARTTGPRTRGMAN